MLAWERTLATSGEFSTLHDIMWRHAPYRRYLLVRTVEAQDCLSLHQNLTSSQMTIIIRIEVCLHTPMETTSKGAGLEKMGGAATPPLVELWKGRA